MDLRERLGGISKQALTNRVRGVKDTVPMSRQHALYVLAFENGLQLDKYLPADELTRVAEQVERYRRATAEQPDSGATSNGARSGKKQSPPPSPRTVVVKVTGAEYRDVPGFMTRLVNDAARSAEGAYPLLYLFENSMRDLIERVLAARYGSTWWDEVPKGIRDKAQRYQDNEVKEKWHTPRGSHPIQYVDLKDLADIMASNKLWPNFEPLFPRKEWVTGLVHDINVSRRIVAHMNTLPKAEIRSLQAAFRKWALQLKAHEHLIP